MHYIDEFLLVRLSGFFSILGTVFGVIELIPLLQGLSYVIAIVSGGLVIREKFKSKRKKQ